MTAQVTLSTLNKTEIEKSAMGPRNEEKTHFTVLGNFGHIFTNFSAPLDLFKLCFLFDLV